MPATTMNHFTILTDDVAAHGRVLRATSSGSPTARGRRSIFPARGCTPATSPILHVIGGKPRERSSCRA